MTFSQMNQGIRATGLLLSILSTAALLLALVSQYGFGHMPCELCVWQRWPHVVAAILGALAFFSSNTKAAWFLLVGAVFAQFTTVGIGAFHVGVEQGWWTGLDACGSNLQAIDLESLKKAIMNAPVVRCTDIAFSVFGISMAGWNMFIFFAVSIFGAYVTYKERAKIF